MDPVMLAAAAMAVIRPLLGKFADAATSKAADAAANAAGSGATALYQAVRKRMARDGSQGRSPPSSRQTPTSPAPSRTSSDR